MGNETTMKTVEQLADDASTLTTADKVILADRLIESIGESENEVLHGNWAAEAIRRRNEVRNGDVKTIPKDEALAQVRRVISQ
jgi:hypothetical protein